VQRIIIFFILIGVSLCDAFAQENSLVSLKILPLPEDKVRIDFHFRYPLSQLPASFITEKPARIVLDFVNTKLELPTEERNKKILLGSLNAYNIVSANNRVRAVIDLDRNVSYSSNMAGTIYTLVLNGKSNDLFNKQQIFITKQVVNAKYSINNLTFRGTAKQGGRAIGFAGFILTVLI